MYGIMNKLDLYKLNIKKILIIMVLHSQVFMEIILIMWILLKIILI